MGFENIGEILHHPHRRFSLEEKQLAVSAVLVLLWKHWDQSIEKWIQTSDVGNMYIATLQREQVTNTLMNLDVGVHGKTV